MNKARLEALSDGVIAIIITIMVLEMKAPHSPDWTALAPVLPVFLCYTLSFLYVAIYWNNHHHLLKACRRVTGGIMWANFHLLFWLSLLPFVTGWLGENHFDTAPSILYGVILLLAAVAYFLLQRLIVAGHGPDSRLAAALGRDWKGRLSPLLYLAGIGLSFWKPAVANSLYLFVALFWLVPDSRIEKVLEGADSRN